MSRPLYIHVYFNGDIFVSDEGVTFRCDSPISGKIKRDATLESLMHTIHRKIGLSRDEVVSEIIYRMPVSVNPIYYKAYQMESDDDIQLIWDTHMQCCGYSVPIELYVAIAVLDEGGPSGSSNPTDMESQLTNDQLQMQMQGVGEQDDGDDDDQYRCLSPNDYIDTESGEDIEEDIAEDDIIPPVQQIPYYVPRAPFMWQINTAVVNEDIAISADMCSEYTWNEEADLKVGLIFRNKESLNEALKLYHVKRRQDYRVSRSNKKYLNVICPNADKGCKFSLRACLKSTLDMWMITKYGGDHICVSSRMTKDHRKLDYHLICGYITTMVGDRPDLPISQIIGRIKDELHFTISYRKAWLAKQDALAQIYGQWEESYDKLQRFMAAIELYMPGSKVEWQTEPYPGREAIIY